MATDFTQNSVLHFLQSSGGSVKNSDLLLHFKQFLQDPANRDRNRELFKKFVNSLAIVKQVDGVSHVHLRKKFSGHVSGGAGPDSPVPAGNYTEPTAVNHAPLGETGRKTVLPTVGIMVENRSKVETNLNTKQKQVHTDSEPAIRRVPVQPQPPVPDLSVQVRQQRSVPVPRPQEPDPEPQRGQEALYQESPLHREPLHQGPSLQQEPPLPLGPSLGLEPIHQQPPLHQKSLLHQDFPPPPLGPSLHQDFPPPPLGPSLHQDFPPPPPLGPSLRQDFPPPPLGPSLRQDLPPPPLGPSLRQDLPPPPLGPSLRQDLPPPPLGPSLRQDLPPPPLGPSLRQDLPPPSLGPSLRRDLPPSLGPSLHQDFPPPPLGPSLRQDLPPPFLGPSLHQDLPPPSLGPSLRRDLPPSLGPSLRQDLPPPPTGPSLHLEPLRQQPPLCQEPPLYKRPYLDQEPPLHLGPPLCQEPPLRLGPLRQEPLRQEPLRQEPPLRLGPLCQGPPLRLGPLRQERPLRQGPPLRQEPPLRQGPLRQGPPLRQEPPLRLGPPLHQEPSLLQGLLDQQLPLHQELPPHYQGPPPPPSVGPSLCQEPPPPPPPLGPSLHQEPPPPPPPSLGLSLSQAPPPSLGLSLSQEPPPPLEPPIRQEPPYSLGHSLQEPPPPPSLGPSLHQEPPPPLGPPIGQESPYSLGQSLQEPLLHPPQQPPPRRIRYRPSYKSAVSQDDDDYEEEEEEVPIIRASPGGHWTQNTPITVSDRSISASLPSITASPSSPSSSSGRPVPQIFIQHTQEEEGSTSTSRGPSEVKPEPGAVTDPESAGVSLQGSHQNQRPSSSLYSTSSNDQFYSTAWPPTRASRWSSSSSQAEDDPVSGKMIHDVLQRSKRKDLEPAALHPANSKTTKPWHHSTGNLLDDQQDLGRLSSLSRSTDCLHEDQDFASESMPWHHSTGDLLDDRDEIGSSEGSISSPQAQVRSAVVRRISTRLRSRMCRSLGTDLDQIVQEEGDVGGGNEAARLSRLHRISSSLSLPFNRSSSSLSSCTTPPNYLSSGEDRRSIRSHLTSISSHGQSLVPLEPREHTWMVKGAAAAWMDIYSLFREDMSLLNKPDFISGFTVLHWIAKHGDHRVLNTLGYGAEKVGMTFEVDAKSTAGQTPLHIAAIHSHKNIIRVLVTKYNANVKLRDTAGKKPWQYLSDQSPDIFQLLGAPPRAAVTGGGDSLWQQPKPPQQRRRLKHHFSSASGLKPLIQVKRSTSIAAFIKNKALGAS